MLDPTVRRERVSAAFYGVAPNAQISGMPKVARLLRKQKA
jgi:hypothetical protein